MRADLISFRDFTLVIDSRTGSRGTRFYYPYHWNGSCRRSCHQAHKCLSLKRGFASFGQLARHARRAGCEPWKWNPSSWTGTTNAPKKWRREDFVDSFPEESCAPHTVLEDVVYCCALFEPAKFISSMVLGKHLLHDNSSLALMIASLYMFTSPQSSQISKPKQPHNPDIPYNSLHYRSRSICITTQLS